MAVAREAVIVGVGDVPLKDGRVVGGGSVLQVQARAAKAALRSDSDERRRRTSRRGSLGVPGPGQLASVTLGEYLGIFPRFADTTNIGGQRSKLMSPTLPWRSKKAIATWR